MRVPYNPFRNKQSPPGQRAGQPTGPEVVGYLDCGGYIERKIAGQSVIVRNDPTNPGDNYPKTMIFTRVGRHAVFMSRSVQDDYDSGYPWATAATIRHDVEALPERYDLDAARKAGGLLVAVYIGQSHSAFSGHNANPAVYKPEDAKVEWQQAVFFPELPSDNAVERFLTTDV